MQQEIQLSAPLEGCSCPDCTAYESGAAFLVRAAAFGLLTLIWLTAARGAAYQVGWL